MRRSSGFNLPLLRSCRGDVFRGQTTRARNSQFRISCSSSLTPKYVTDLPSPSCESTRFIHAAKPRHEQGSQEWTDSENHKRVFPSHGIDHVRNEMDREECQQKSDTRLNREHGSNQ